MKANELRIGNLIEHEDPNEIVEGIHYIDEGKYKILIGNYLRNLEEIKPIPLTKEWLLKFGFESTGDYHFSKNGLNFHFLMDTMILEDEKSHPLGKSFNCVHQLQNLYFALTGQELTINQ